MLVWMINLMSLRKTELFHGAVCDANNAMNLKLDKSENGPYDKTLLARKKDMI